MRGGVRIGRIIGIDIYIDWSWLFIFLLVIWELAGDVFPSLHPGWSPLLTWGTALVASLLFFGSVLAHELVHSAVARARGIPVRNIILFLFGGVSNIQREPASPGAEFQMAIVGPLASLAIGVLSLVLGNFLAVNLDRLVGNAPATLAGLDPLATLLLWLGPVNLLLGAFNLIPGFPLDGGRVLRSILWAMNNDLELATEWASWIGQGIAWLLVLAGISMMFGVALPFFGSGILSGLWLAFIGLFLNNAAVESYRQIVVQDLLGRVTVARLMSSPVPTVAPNIPVSSLVHDHIMGTDARAFPVIDNGRLVGLVCIHDIRKVPRARWETTEVGEIMTAANQLTIARPDELASDAFDDLARCEVNQLPVLQHGRVVGMLRRSDIVRWLELAPRHKYQPGPQDHNNNGTHTMGNLLR